MGWLPKSFWAKVGEFAIYAAETYVASKSGTVPAGPPLPVPQPQPPAPPPVAVAPPVAAPEPAPAPMTLEQKWGDRFDAICMEEWGRVMGRQSSDDLTDRLQNYKLLDAGREDEVRKNLRARK